MYGDECDATEDAEDDDDPAAAEEDHEGHFLLEVEVGFVDDLSGNVSGSCV
tara:strand:+ start:14814 stop:14966 length:153 start_codon:yes stop_codon:yes gene_type:complete